MPVTREITVPVTKLVPVTKQGTRTVMTGGAGDPRDHGHVEKCVPVTKQATRTVMTRVPVTREITVPVTKLVP